MKTNLLILIAVSIFLALIIFVIFIYSINSISESQEFQRYIGGGGIDLDPDLSPSYALEFTGYLEFNSIFVILPIMLGIISLVFLVPNIILRIKKIPPRKYMLIIAAAVLIFFGSGYVNNGLQSLLTLEHLEQENDWIVLIGCFVSFSIGMVFIIPGIIVLRKAKLRIRK